MPDTDNIGYRMMKNTLHLLILIAVTMASIAVLLIGKSSSQHDNDTDDESAVCTTILSSAENL